MRSAGHRRPLSILSLQGRRDCVLLALLVRPTIQVDSGQLGGVSNFQFGIPAEGDEALRERGRRGDRIAAKEGITLVH